MMENEIKHTLQGLMRGIERGESPAIVDGMARLDHLVREAGDQLHPQLAHFLTRRSYAKALMYLDGATDIPPGLCGGKAGRPPSPDPVA